MQLTIPARFNGPTGSGNGGVVSGLLAGLTPLTGGRVAQVTLRRPPPLERALELRTMGDGAELWDGEDLVASSSPVPFGSLGEAVESVPLPVAVAAAKEYAGFTEHPFPTCFACGTERKDGAGLGLTPGPLPGDRSRTATPFTLRPESVVENPVEDVDWVLWAALDCPGGWTIDLLGRPAVLGRMSAQVVEIPSEGEECVVVGVLDRREGRKSFSRTTVYGADNRELARAAATWIDI